VRSASDVWLDWDTLSSGYLANLSSLKEWTVLSLCSTCLSLRRPCCSWHSCHKPSGISLRAIVIRIRSRDLFFRVSQCLSAPHPLLNGDNFCWRRELISQQVLVRLSEKVSTPVALVDRRGCLRSIVLWIRMNGSIGFSQISHASSA